MVRKRDRAATRADLEEVFSGVSVRFDRLEAEVGGLKDDVGGLKDDVGGLKGEVVGLKDDVAGLKGEVGGLKTRFDGLESKMTDLAGNVYRLNLGFTALDSGMKDLAEGLREEMHAVQAGVTAQIEPFAGRMETIWRESIVYPKMLDEQGARLDAHDKRLAALEAGRTP